jgi:uncharacterized protein Veg
MSLDNIKEDVRSHLHCKVLVSVFGMRNKNYQVRGFISNVYPSIFTVNENGVEKSFNYSDIATKEIILEYL